MGYNLIVLFLACLSLSLSIVQAGTVKLSNIEDSDSITPTSFNALSFAQPREGSFGRSLALKSILLAPIGILLLLALAVAFIPLPVISAPAAGRLFSTDSRAFKIFQNMITSEECIERISCEVSKVSKDYELSSWIPASVDKYLKSSIRNARVSRGMSSIKSCRKFSCNPANVAKRAFEVYS